MPRHLGRCQFGERQSGEHTTTGVEALRRAVWHQVWYVLYCHNSHPILGPHYKHRILEMTVSSIDLTLLHPARLLQVRPIVAVEWTVRPAYLAVSSVRTCYLFIAQVSCGYLIRLKLWNDSYPMLLTTVKSKKLCQYAASSKFVSLGSKSKDCICKRRVVVVCMWQLGDLAVLTQTGGGVVGAWNQ